MWDKDISENSSLADIAISKQTNTFVFVIYLWDLITCQRVGLKKNDDSTSSLGT